MFDARCYFSKSDPFKQGKILTASCLLRGRNLSTFESEKTLAQQLSKHSTQFVEWIPDNMMNTICHTPAAGLASNVSGTVLANSSCQAEGFRTLLESFDAMFKRKAYLHWFTQEGMDHTEFSEAASNVRDLLSEYQQYEEARIDEGEDDDEEMDMLAHEQKASAKFNPNGSLRSNTTLATANDMGQSL